MRIGIFGGSFNPPHKMHESIAASLIEQGTLDKVIFVPTGSKYKYKNNLLPDKDRYEMVRLITDKHDNLEVDAHEMNLPETYTIETLDYFKNEYPKDEIYFICGSDNLTYMDRWKYGFCILSNYKVLVIKRETDNIDKILKRFIDYKDNIIVADMEMMRVSSTMIREDVESNKNLLDKDVYNYIKKNHLYEEG